MTPIVDATDQLVKRIALVAAGFGALAALWMGSKAGLSGALSSVVGTAVGVGNLWALAKLLTKIVDRKADSSRGRAMALLVLKTLGVVEEWSLCGGHHGLCAGDSGRGPARRLG